MSASKAHKERFNEIREICERNNIRMPMRNTKAVMKSLASEPLTERNVISSCQNLFPSVMAPSAERPAAVDCLEILQEKFRGRLRIDGESWLTKIQLDIAKTAVHAWIRIDRVHPEDLALLSQPESCKTSLGNLAQRLRAARKYEVDPMRQACADLDINSFFQSDDEDLVHVRTAMRRLEIKENDPSTVLLVIERAFRDALKRSKAINALTSDPYNLEKIGALPSDHRKRRVIALIGPTNSGKTHDGIEMLCRAKTGAYLGPLRLMAMEQYDRLSARGLPISMKTGEEIISSPGDTHVSSTIEMADVKNHHEVVLIDEIQLLSDPTRGWAWTRAMFHSHCDTLILAGSEDALPYIENILAMTGEELEIRRHERRTPLQFSPTPVSYNQLRKGDAIIAFSRVNVLAMKAELSQRVNPSTGKPYSVATIYGALSPEVRRTEAARFSRGEADILVATDAVGMGLNLPIDRVIFSALKKYDGSEVRALLPSEIRQIGGRAGRTGQAMGEVSVLEGVPGNMDAVRHALEALPEKPRDSRPFIVPDLEQAMVCIEHMQLENLSKALPAVSAILRKSAGFRSHVDPDTLDLIQTAEQSGLSHEDAFEWIGCPISLRDRRTRKTVEKWMRSMAQREPASVPKIPAPSDFEINDKELKLIEERVTQACAYLWLSRRWPEHFPYHDEAIDARGLGNQLIESALRQKRIRIASQYI